MNKQRFIFDLDGTLLKADYSYEQAYFKSVLNKEEAEIFIPNIMKLLTSYENTYLNYEIDTFSNFLSEKSGVNITTKIIYGWLEALINAPSKTIDGVEETLEYLKQQDKSIVVLSNWFTEVQKKRLNKNYIFNYFEEVYGGDIFLKPNKESYINACGRYSLEECIMIGDSLMFDVYGPMNIGLDSIYYNPNENNYDKVKVKSINNINKIKEMY